MVADGIEYAVVAHHIRLILEAQTSRYGLALEQDFTVQAVA